MWHKNELRCLVVARDWAKLWVAWGKADRIHEWGNLVESTFSFQRPDQWLGLVQKQRISTLFSHRHVYGRSTERLIFQACRLKGKTYNSKYCMLRWAMSHWWPKSEPLHSVIVGFHHAYCPLQLQTHWTDCMSLTDCTSPTNSTATIHWEKNFFCKTLFQVRMHGPEKSAETRHAMKECKKTIRHVQKIHSRCRIVFLCSFISCLVSVSSSGPSLLEMKFCKNFSIISILFGEVSKPTSKFEIILHSSSSPESQNK